MRRLLPLLLAACLPVGVHAKDTAIQFAPPPFAMTNLVVNDALEGKGLDYMGLKGNGFDLKCGTYSQSSMDRYWDQGGFVRGAAFQLIYGTLDTGGSDRFSLFGEGFTLPLTWYYDPLSQDDDDNSLPIYIGVHGGMMLLSGRMSFETTVLDHYDSTGPPFYISYPVYRNVTDTLTLDMLQVQIGWHAGIQYGLNLGDQLKVIPYVNLSQDVYNLSNATESAIYSPIHSSTSTNLGVLPVAVAPGFDVVLRKIGLSLGAAYQSTSQAGGSMKQINLHFHWSRKFRSICGA